MSIFCRFSISYSLMNVTHTTHTNTSRLCKKYIIVHCSTIHVSTVSEFTQYTCNDIKSQLYYNTCN